MEQAIAMFEHAGLRGHFQGDGSMLVTTPSEVTLRFSVERRRPWGDGLTCTLRLPTADQPRLNLELAALLNRTEWNDVPAVNVWGGWAGTDTALELHSFVPRMLFRPDADQARTIVANLLTWCVNRGHRAEQMLYR
jgi:hypothetical protein